MVRSVKKQALGKVEKTEKKSLSNLARELIVSCGKLFGLLRRAAKRTRPINFSGKDDPFLSVWRASTAQVTAKNLFGVQGKTETIRSKKTN